MLFARIVPTCTIEEHAMSGSVVFNHLKVRLNRFSRSADPSPSSRDQVSKELQGEEREGMG